MIPPNVAVPPSPMAAGFVGKAVRITPADVAAAAVRLRCPTAVIAAVLAVESSGSGFDSVGRPKILFEPHVFYRELQGRPDTLALAERAGLAYPKQGQVPYPAGSEANYQRLKRACLLDPDAAMKSASWGIAQVMGFNHVVGGYPNVVTMVQACMDSEARQFDLLLGYAEAHGLANVLRNKDWMTFARAYNGPGAVTAYSTRLQAAYRQLSAAPPDSRQYAPLTLPVALKSGAAPAVTADSLMEQEWLRIRSGQSRTA